MSSSCLVKTLLPSLLATHGLPPTVGESILVQWFSPKQSPAASLVVASCTYWAGPEGVEGFGVVELPAWHPNDPRRVSCTPMICSLVSGHTQRKLAKLLRYGEIHWLETVTHSTWTVMSPSLSSVEFIACLQWSLQYPVNSTQSTATLSSSL